MATSRAIVTGAYAAEELLHCGVHQRGVGREAGAIIGMLREMPERRTDRRPRCVDAGHHQQHHRALDVIGMQFVALELGFEQERGEIVTGLGEVLLDAAPCR